MMKHTILICALGACVVGCGHDSARTQQVRSAAAVDLGCEESAIKFVEEEPTRVRVEGCGDAMTYRYQCRAVSRYGGPYGESASEAAVQECRWAPVEEK
jgi:hypothetical protein